mmetsp:Transcript_1675/g.2211  ORF Transcript_1675/g.2211 Transcript_1675/m.2211 type:complete len:192 (-) Transcript_1675:151-726(-)
MSNKDAVPYQVNTSSIFPAAKIKSLLRQEEDIGRVYASAVDLIGASSAIFIKNLTNSAISIAKEETKLKSDADTTAEDRNCTKQQLVITAEHIRQCISQYGEKFDFLRDVVSEKFETVPNYSQVISKANNTSKRKKTINGNTSSKKRAIKKNISDTGLDNLLNLDELGIIPENSYGGAIGDKIVEDEEDYD